MNRTMFLYQYVYTSVSVCTYVNLKENLIYYHGNSNNLWEMIKRFFFSIHNCYILTVITFYSRTNIHTYDYEIPENAYIYIRTKENEENIIYVPTYTYIYMDIFLLLLSMMLLSRRSYINLPAHTKVGT